MKIQLPKSSFFYIKRCKFENEGLLTKKGINKKDGQGNIKHTQGGKQLKEIQTHTILFPCVKAQVI